MIKALDASKIGISCEECRPVDLMEENEELIALVDRYPSVVRGEMGLRTDFENARMVADMCGYDEAWLIEHLEAFVRGAS